MTKNEINELFNDGDDKIIKHHISASALANIMKFANVDLRMDTKTLDYYYEVSIDILLDSEMPDEEYKVMKEQGWFIEGNFFKILI